MTASTRVVKIHVRLPEAAWARLRLDAYRRGIGVGAVVADLATAAAAALPAPGARPRRTMAEVLQERVAELLAAGRTVEDIAAELGVPVARVREVAAVAPLTERSA